MSKTQSITTKKRPKALLYLGILAVVVLSIFATRNLSVASEQSAQGSLPTLVVPTQGLVMLPTFTATPDYSQVCGQESIKLPTYVQDGKYGIDSSFVPQPGQVYYIEQPDWFKQLWTQDGSLEELESWDPFKARYDSYDSWKQIWNASLGWGNSIRNEAKRNTELFERYFQNYGAAYYLQMVTWIRAYVTDPSNPANSCLRFPDGAPAISADERAELQKSQGPDLPGRSSNASIPNPGPTTQPTAFGPPATATMVVGPENNPFNLELAKIKSACETTSNPGLCVSETLRMRDTGGDLVTALNEGVADGNSGCTVQIGSIDFYQISGRGDIRNATRVLHVIRIDNNDPTRLSAVGAVGPDGRPSVCINEITNAPSTVEGGTWLNASNNVMGPTADKYPWFRTMRETASGPSVTMFGGVISFDPLYPPDMASLGIYGVSSEYLPDGTSWAWYEVPIGGLYLSPISGLPYGNPTATPWPSQTPIPPPIVRIMAVTSTPGATPTPANVTIDNLKSYAANLGHTRFFLFVNCNGAAQPPGYPSSVYLDDGRFDVIMNLTGINIGCSYHDVYAAITTDNMTGEGWSEYGGLWVSP